MVVVEGYTHGQAGWTQHIFKRKAERTNQIKSGEVVENGKNESGGNEDGLV